MCLINMNWDSFKFSSGVRVDGLGIETLNCHEALLKIKKL